MYYSFRVSAPHLPKALTIEVEGDTLEQAHANLTEVLYPVSEGYTCTHITAQVNAGAHL